MTKLPFEIYIKIFALLPQKAKLECALVCHQWTEATLRCLYAQVSIKSQGTLDKFINSLEYKPFRRNHVKGISLFEPYQFDFDKRKLCQIFPNLQSVQLFKFNIETPSTDISNRVIRSSNVEPKSTIRSIDENGTCDFILYLVQSNLCGQLERLSLSCNPKFGSRETPLHLLKNMASLKMLTLGLHDYEFTIHDMDMIFENIPSITHFKCFGATLGQNNLPSKVKSNSFAKSISLNFSRIYASQSTSDIHCEWLIYISSKYTGLQKLFININEYGTSSFEDKKHIFENGWLPVLQSIGPQIERIGNVNIPNSINIFKVLDDSECKIKHVSIISTPGTFDPLDGFAQSNQRICIQKLVIKNVVINANISLKDTKLVELELVFSLCNTASLSINDFLKKCPLTLKCLTMENIDIHCDGFDDYRFPSLTTISINKNGSVPVKSEIKETVRKCCPNLKHLHLSNPSINFFI